MAVCFDKKSATLVSAGANGAFYDKELDVDCTRVYGLHTWPCVSLYTRSRAVVSSAWISFERAFFSGFALSMKRSM